MQNLQLLTFKSTRLIAVTASCWSYAAKILCVLIHLLWPVFWTLFSLFPLQAYLLWPDWCHLWACFIQWYTGCCCCWCWGRARQPHWTSCRSNSSGLCWMVSGKKESWCLSTFESFHWPRFPNICTTVTGFFAKYISASLTVFFTDTWYIWVCFEGGGMFHPWFVTVLLAFFV